MTGAAVYRLRAQNSARLPLINGRLMHAAFFKILHEISPELERFVHDRQNIKPFTVSFLDPLAELPSAAGRWDVRRGDKFYWRVTGLNEEILNAAFSVPVGCELQAGGLILVVEDVDARAVDLIADVREMPAAEELALKFVTPVSFRIDEFDAPYPRAELIFGSLADKWIQAEMPAAVDRQQIRELAAQVRLTEWAGRSKKFYLAHDRGALGFWGSFRYSLGALGSDWRKVFMLLAKFAEYAGVGRLCGQGFGQTRVNFQ